MAEESPEAGMPNLEDRVSILEDKFEHHDRGIQELREMVRHLDGKMDRRLDAVDRKFEVLDQKMDRRFDNVDARFNWIVGIQIVLLLAVIGALLR